MRPDLELKGAMSVVQYEFNRFIGTCLVLSGHFQVTVGSGPNASAPMPDALLDDFCVILRDAVLEAFLIHARNLIDFFIGPSNYKKEDVIAADYFSSPDVWRRGLKKDGLHKVRERIGKKLAHLTYRRLQDADGWNPRDLVERIVVLRDRFNALGPAYLIAVDVQTLKDEPVKP
jgi:hypothetical protein